MIRFFFIFCSFCIHILSYSQTRESSSENIITLFVTGEGSTNEDALTNGISNAFTQVLKVYILTSTKEINKELIINESLATYSGIVQKVEVITQQKFGNNTFLGTYKIVISFDKLKDFFESKGINIELPTGIFTKIIKQQMLLEESELESVWKSLFVLNPVMNKSFDYKYQTFDPVSIDGNSKFKIRFMVNCISNQNQVLVFDYLNLFLKGLSMSKSEQLNYQKANKAIWGIKIDGNKYFLRNEKSFHAFQLFFNELLYIERRFVIKDNLKNLLGSNANYIYGEINNPELVINSVKGTHHNLNETNWSSESSSYDTKHTDNYSGFEDLDDCNINFNTGGSVAPGYFVYSLGDEKEKFGLAYKKNAVGKIIKTYDFSITYTLGEIEKINDIKIHHISNENKIGQWFRGGVIFFEDSINYLLHPIGFKYFRFGSYQNCCDTMSTDPNDKCPDILMCNLDEYKLKDDLKDVFLKTFTDTSIGSGIVNTKKLSSIARQYNNPFKYINSIEINGFNGWYVPSKIEAELLLTYAEKYYPRFLQTFTSSLKKGKEYNIYWDSFYIPRKDNDDNNSNKFHLPFKKNEHDELFFGNDKTFIPIRIEKH